MKKFKENKKPINNLDILDEDLKYIHANLDKKNFYRNKSISRSKVLDLRYVL